MKQLYKRLTYIFGLQQARSIKQNPCFEVLPDGSLVELEWIDSVFTPFYRPIDNKRTCLVTGNEELILTIIHQGLTLATTVALLVSDPSQTQALEKNKEQVSAPAFSEPIPATLGDILPPPPGVPPRPYYERQLAVLKKAEKAKKEGSLKFYHILGQLGMTVLMIVIPMLVERFKPQTGVSFAKHTIEFLSPTEKFVISKKLLLGGSVLILVEIIVLLVVISYNLSQLKSVSTPLGVKELRGGYTPELTPVDGVGPILDEGEVNESKLSQILLSFLIGWLKKVLEKYPTADSVRKVLAVVFFHIGSNVGIYRSLMKTILFPNLPMTVPMSYFVSALIYVVNYVFSFLSVLKKRSIVPTPEQLVTLALTLFLEELADHFTTRQLILSTAVKINPSVIRAYKLSMWRLAIMSNKMADCSVESMLGDQFL